MASNSIYMLSISLDFLPLVFQFVELKRFLFKSLNMKHKIAVVIAISSIVVKLCIAACSEVKFGRIRNLKFATYLKFATC